MSDRHHGPGPAVRPQVSVISAWYNRPEDLAASVRSVLDQAGVELEYIVIDDASDDGETWPALQAIKDPRLRLERNEANVGFTRSMRRAAALAQGEHVAVHDAGDISLPGRLAVQAVFLDAHPDHVAVGVGVVNRNLETGEQIPEPAPSAGEGIGGTQYTHGEVMFRREAYEAVGGYRDVFYYSQDSDLWRRLLDRGRLGYIPEVFYERRIFAGGVLGNPKKQMLQAIFSNLSFTAAAARDRGLSDPVDQRFALALLTQPRTPRLKRYLTWRTKELLSARRYSEARSALEAVPTGMMSWRLLLTYLALRLLTGGKDKT